MKWRITLVLLLSALVGCSAGDGSHAYPSVDNAGTAASPTSPQLPAGVCAADAPGVQLHDGRARNTSHALTAALGRGDFTVSVSPNTWPRADIDDNGTDDLVLPVTCEALAGGTGSFPEIVIFSTDDGEMMADVRPDGRGLQVGSASVTVITDPADLSAVGCTTSGAACRSSVAIRAVTKSFNPGDPMCCPTATGETTWRWDGEGLAQVDPAHTDCWNGQAPANPPARFDPSAGQYSAYIRSVEPTGSRVHFGIVRWLSGADAVAAYHAANPNDPAGPPNDFYLDDTDPTPGSATVDVDASILALTNRSNALLSPASLASIAEAVDGHREPTAPRVYWLTFSNSTITDICEQYRP